MFKKKEYEGENVILEHCKYTNPILAFYEYLIFIIIPLLCTATSRIYCAPVYGIRTVPAICSCPSHNSHKCRLMYIPHSISTDLGRSSGSP